MDIDCLRRKIDEADDELLRAFCRRMELSGEIAGCKAEGGIPVRDPARERQKLREVNEKTDAPFKAYSAELYSLLLDLSRRYQNSLLGRGDCPKGGVFGLLGDGLSHSFSPQIHSILGHYEYRLFEKSPGELEDFLLTGGFDGLNVTMPHKRAALPYCAALSDSAKKTGCVNTILRMPGGGLRGDNTDLFGFSYMLKKLGVSARGKRALVLGSGGASLAVQTVLREHGAGEITVISRSGEDNYSNISKHRGAEIIVNATPVGMLPFFGEAPVDLRDFPECGAVLDLVYNPLKTALLLDAEELGIPCIGGLSMLAAQAKKTSELFMNRTLPDGLIDGVTDIITRKRRNIALIGMPGCGKSTVGAALAAICGREFFDTDEMAGRRANRPVPDIIDTEGEAAFRSLETEALREAAAQTGCVIASGGGVVLREENLRLLRQNSVIVFLDRELSGLSSEGRPLSQAYGVGALAEERLPLYRQWSDFSVQVRGISRTAERIREILMA